jgi:hypothetical protein
MLILLGTLRYLALGGRRRSSIVLLAVAFAAAAAVVAAPAVAYKHTKSATRIHRYAPFSGGEIAPGVKVARTVSGSCSTPSTEDRRNDAYRCIIGNVVHDPCFADKTGTPKYVLCPLYWPLAKVLRINLTQPLPRNSSPTRAAGYPWAVQTATGAWCVLYTGPRYPVLQFTISYLCLSPEGFLLDKPHRGTTWTALFAPGYKAVDRPPGSYRLVDLASAWW